MNIKKTPLLLLSCAYFYAPVTMAADNTPIKPKLIKMSGAQNASYGIKIIKGKITKTKKITTAQKEIAPKANKKKIANIISTKSCADENNPNQNRNIADSLKAYLSAKNQSPTIIDDILYASNKTNVDFELLIVKAMIESNLGRLTEAKNSSARGIFQYIDSTWLTLLKRYGDRIGHTKYADTLQINPKTLQAEPQKNSRFSRKELLELRYNSRIASLIKAHQIKDDEHAVKSLKNNGIITATDHYIAHMMGIPLAKEFYTLLNNESHIILTNSKSSQFERAAKLNPAFFNDHNGNALGIHDAYQKFHDKISARYDRIRNIHKQYGNGALNRSDCNLPTIKTADL